jgi:hypothetical protein
MEMTSDDRRGGVEGGDEKIRGGGMSRWDGETKRVGGGRDGVTVAKAAAAVEVVTWIDGGARCAVVSSAPSL